MITGNQISKLRNTKSSGKQITGADISSIRESQKRQVENQTRSLPLANNVQHTNPARQSMDIKADINRMKELSNIKQTSKERDYISLSKNSDYTEKSKVAGKDPGYMYDTLNDTIVDNGIFKNYFDKKEPQVNSLSQLEKSYKKSINTMDDNLDASLAYKNMTDNDKGIYNYLFNTEGKKAADEYLDSYIKNFTAKLTKTQTGEIQNFAKEHPVLGSIASVAATFEKPAGMIYSMKQGLNGKEIDPNSTAFFGSNAQNTIRNTVKQDNNMGKVGSFLYDTGMSTLDSLAASLTNPTLGATLLAGGAGSDAAKQAKDKGATDKQAMLSGLTSAVAEGLFERVSLGNFKALKEVPIKTVKDIAKNTLKSIGVNASEEAATEMANIISDYVIMDDLSDFNQDYNGYLQEGYSDKDAYRSTIKDMAVRVGMAAAGGALSGGAMSAVGQGTNFIVNRSANKMNGGIEQGTTLSQVPQKINPDIDNSIPIEKISDTMEKSEPVKAMEARVLYHNEDTKITGISKIEDGQAEINIVSDGKNITDKLSEVEFDNPEMQAVYSKAEDYKTNGAKAFVYNYSEDNELESYQKGFSAYYDAGIINMPLDKVESAYGALLPEGIRLNAYNAGINDAKISEAQPVQVGNKTFGVVESQSALKMDTDTLKALNELGKISKTEIHIEESLAGGMANGMYVNGALYIALDSDNPYLTVAKHELTHAIQDSSPELYKKYREFVISEINKTNPKAYSDMVENLISRYSDMGQTITRDVAMDDIVADASEMFLTDKESIEKLANENKSLGEKVIEIIKEIIDRIQKAISNLEPRSKAAKTLNENLESVKEAEKLWIEALAARTGDTVEVKNEKAPDIRYQLKEIEWSEYNRLYQENNKLREINSLLNEQFKLTNELTPDRKQIEMAAKEILKSTQSSYSSDAMTENLEIVWKFVHNHPDQMYTDDAIAAVTSMAKMILKKSQATDNTLVENSEEMLEDIKKTPLILSQKDRSDMASEGGLLNFRRKYMGKIKLVASDGIKVDEYYQELTEKYPEFFTEDITHPADQLIKIAEVIDFIKPINYNPYGMSYDEAARDLANEIISKAFFNIRQAPPTFADKQKTQLNKLRARYNQSVRELREDYKNKYQDRLKSVREINLDKIKELQEKSMYASMFDKIAYEEKINKLKDINLQKLKAQQERFHERMDTARERRNRTVEANKYKTKIKSITKDLSDMLLHPSDGSHLPKGFTRAIKEVCQILDFESGTLGDEGEPTKAALKWRKLKDEYAALKDSDDDGINSLYLENVETDFQDLAGIIEGRRVNQLNQEELKSVYEIMKHIKHLVSLENKTFADNLRMTIAATGDAIINQLSKEQYSQSSLTANSKTIKTFTDMLTKGNIKPYYFFKRMGGEMEKLYKNVRDGEDTFVKNFEDGNAFAHRMEKKHDYFSWADDKPQEFVTEKGAKISLTTEQKLYIYAAFRRKQGQQHILKGGVVVEEPKVETEVKNGIKQIKKVTYQADPVQFTEMDMKRLEDTLTEEQKGFVSDMVEYLSEDLSKLGNEVANRLFGVDAYTEENYIPLTSDRSYINTKAGITDDKRIKKMSFTKPTVRNANNPIIATGFMEVWSKHLVDMSMYNAMVVPLEDFQRVWNYKYKVKGTGEMYSVKNAIKKAYGPEANKYIEKLMIDINGGIRQDVGGEFSSLMLSKMKVDAVMGNLSVAIQQPSSLARAFVIIDPKYFVKTTFNKRDYSELIKYSPQAKLKQYGYFDVNMGRNLSSVVTEKELETPLEKIKAFFTDKNVRNEVFSWLPQKMDEITWCHIWNAVKEETKETTKLQESSEEFYNHCKERFKEVIDRSQVMDSVFQRSELMRSQNYAAKLLTNFMAEPTVSYNILYDAITEFKKNGKKSAPYVSRSVGAVVSAMVLNSLLKSIITAGRDKDEEKKYGEKYLDSFLRNLADDPLGMIPYVNSVYSVFKGYDPIRPDMQLFQNLYYAGTKLDSKKYTTKEKILQITQAIAPFFNVPLKNIAKDIEMIWRNGSEFLESAGITEGLTEYEKLQNKYPSVDSSAASGKYYDILYQAKINGDIKLYQRIYSDLINSGKKPSNIEEAMRSRMREGLIIRKEGQEFTHPDVVVAYEAFIKQNEKDYQTALKKLIGEGYSPDDVQWAVNYLKTEKSKAEAPTSEEFIKAYKTGRESVWKPLYDKMRVAGWTQKDILALVK